MKKATRYNRLIINSGILDCEGSERVFLFRSSQLKEVVYNDEDYGYAKCYRLNEYGYMEIANDILREDDFDELYYKADENDDKEIIEFFETLYDYELNGFVKACWDNHYHYLLLSSQHGTNTSFYDFDEGVEVISGVCYESDYCIEQDYPNTEHQYFFKFVADDGREFYIKETYPFFTDEHDYIFEVITKEDFEKYEK